MCLYNDTANSSDCLMSNVKLISDELVGRRKYIEYIISFGHQPEGRGFDSR